MDTGLRRETVVLKFDITEHIMNICCRSSSAMDGFDLASGRNSSGRFLPGTSGNPAGKRPGTRNRKTVLAEALHDGEDTAVARIVIDKALAGDAVVARFCLGLLSPKPRGRAIEIDLPENAAAGDVVAAFDATLAAMAAGEITPDEALIVTRVLDGRRALETLALQRRLDAEVARMAASEALEREVDAMLASDDSDNGGETPEACESAKVSLHSACISPSPDNIRGIVAALPAAERRLVAAMVRRGRTAASTASPPA
jgi:hypothetical protein